ncbi:hypothetical protein ADK60_32010 [Streptomyces sp. XY431]|uniref:hypothetical protein n=1 Tax=Streptomyces sp. XY431 TaxID=1415562 RepID=UPI0006AEF1BB|nr:hypothetical protein [Streptomyces sp. XY431]KOV12340.1 hypothetical protein ADK60_32010 [Streptomyces sp. XY431]
MTDRPSRPRPYALVAYGLLAVLGSATAIVAAFSASYAMCALGLAVLGGAALAAYWTARAGDARTDQLVLERLRREPVLDADALAVELALRPAAVRLSFHRLSRNGSLPMSDSTPDIER